MSNQKIIWAILMSCAILGYADQPYYNCNITNGRIEQCNKLVNGRYMIQKQTSYQRVLLKGERKGGSIRYLVQDFFLDGTKRTDPFYVDNMDSVINTRFNYFDDLGILGPFTQWSRDGVQIVKGQFKNGQPDGRWEFWYFSGEKQAQESYQNTQPDGMWIEWAKNGQKVMQKNYKNGVLHGDWQEWYENGQKKLEKHYLNGQLTGILGKWLENGQQLIEQNYHLGQLTGKFTQWYPNGQIQVQGYYRSGKKHNLWSTWYENGQKSSEGEYQANKRDGDWKMWHDNGLLQMSGYLTMGKQGDGSWRCWDRNGKQYKDDSYEICSIKMGLGYESNQIKAEKSMDLNKRNQERLVETEYKKRQQNRAIGNVIRQIEWYTR